VAEARPFRTIAELRDAISLQLKAMSPTPSDDARELLAALHDAPLSWSSVHANDEPLDLLIARVDDAVARRLSGAPMAYATQRAAFRHMFLHVDSRVLIPRPETEELVTLALPLISAGSIVVDVGTGSGAIALAIASESAAARVIGTDLSPDAIAVAELNARAVLRPAHARTEFRHGNLLEPVAELRVNVIVSNPPYIATPEIDELPPLVRDWEPAMALFSGTDGMEAIDALALQAEDRLASGGTVLVEIDSRRGARAMAAFQAPAWQDVQLCQDAFGRDRFLMATRAPREGGQLSAAPDATGHDPQ
jgi:release factor glutamine methyltransferase